MSTIMGGAATYSTPYTGGMSMPSYGGFGGFGGMPSYGGFGMTPSLGMTPSFGLGSMGSMGSMGGFGAMPMPSLGMPSFGVMRPGRQFGQRVLA